MYVCTWVCMYVGMGSVGLGEMGPKGIWVEVIGWDGMGWQLRVGVEVGIGVGDDGLGL